jgi:nucleoside-triphosphatase
MRSPLDSPAATVAGLAATGAPQLVLVSGPRGAGKTTWCSQLVHEARERGVGVAGVLSPHALDDEGVRLAIDLVDVSTGEQRRIAVRGDATAPQAAGLPRAWWTFDQDALAWGEAVLGRVDGTELLVVDELGVLEFRHGAGLVSGLRLVGEGRYRMACVVIRPELLDLARARWPRAETRWAGEP